VVQSLEGRQCDDAISSKELPDRRPLGRSRRERSNWISGELPRPKLWSEPRGKTAMNGVRRLSSAWIFVSHSIYDLEFVLHSSLS
jgi:hypothetical protein